jgi:hypothetical protein
VTFELMQPSRSVAMICGLGLLAACARPPGSPGAGCSLASCCVGWLWVMGICEPAQVPFCGCSCSHAPVPYSSEEQCLEDHPGARPRKPLGALK